MPLLERPAAFALVTAVTQSLSIRCHDASQNITAGDHMIASRKREVIGPQIREAPFAVYFR
jgi:hypothetical protein